MKDYEDFDTKPMTRAEGTGEEWESLFDFIYFTAADHNLSPADLFVLWDEMLDEVIDGEDDDYDSDEGWDEDDDDDDEDDEDDEDDDDEDADLVDEWT